MQLIEKKEILASFRPGVFALRISHPARTFVAEMKDIRMNDLRKDLQRLDETRARTIEVLITIGNKHSTIANGIQALPLGSSAEQVHFFKRAANVKTTRRDE